MSSSMFKKLYNLLHISSHEVQEDFLTEIIAELFRDAAILTDFFREFGIMSANPERIAVLTQVPYKKLDGHQTDSRPDLVIKFTEKQQHVVFIENKLGSMEGDQQLRRYSDHLQAYSRQGVQTCLIYITQHPETKTAVHPHFIQLRWYQVFHWLKRHFSTNSFAEKVIEYMEEIGLNDSRQFTPHDMYAIQHMNRLQRMMDECMDGPVDEVMNELYGKPLLQYNRYNQLKYMERYFKASEQTNRATEVGCGFYLTNGDYPIVSVVYEVNKSCADKQHVISCMKHFLNDHPGWEPFDLDAQQEWVGISYARSLLDFLAHEDHINEIQAFFLEKLKELHELKTQFPDLHWK